MEQPWPHPVYYPDKRFQNENFFIWTSYRPRYLHTSSAFWFGEMQAVLVVHSSVLRCIKLKKLAITVKRIKIFMFLICLLMILISWFSAMKKLLFFKLYLCLAQKRLYVYDCPKCNTMIFLHFTLPFIYTENGTTVFDHWIWK